MAEGKIWNISLTGSIHCPPVGIVEEMEAALKWVPGTEAGIGEVVYSFFQKPGVQIAAAQPADFLQTIMAAVRMAQMKPKN